MLVVMNQRKIKKNELFIFIFLFIMIFQSILEQYIGVFSITDEIVALAVFTMGVVNVLKGKIIEKFDAILLLCVLTFWMVGWISTLVYQYQSISVSLVSSFLSIKFFLFMLGVKWYWSNSFCDNLRRPLLLITFIFFVYYLLSRSFETIHSIYLWDICAKSVCLLALLLIVKKNNIHDYICMAMPLFMLMVTGAAKAKGAIALFVLIYLYVVKWKKKVTILEIGVGAVCLIMVAWKKIYYYYFIGAGSFARSVMMQTGAKIANDYFPFGTGWGTFGSYYSEKYYSPVFRIYGLDTHRELGEASRSFITDAYWPSVMGENGWIGFGAILAMIVLLFIQFSKLYRININMYAAGLFVLLYMMVTTIEETGFAQPVLMCNALIMGILLQKTKSGLLQREKVLE